MRKEGQGKTSDGHAFGGGDFRDLKFSRIG